MVNDEQEAARCVGAEVEPSGRKHPAGRRIEALLQCGRGYLQLFDACLGRELRQVEMRERDAHLVHSQGFLLPTCRAANKSAAERVMMDQQGGENPFELRMFDTRGDFEQHRLVEMFDRPCLLEKPTLDWRQR